MEMFTFRKGIGLWGGDKRIIEKPDKRAFIRLKIGYFSNKGESL